MPNNQPRQDGVSFQASANTHNIVPPFMMGFAMLYPSYVLWVNRQVLREFVATRTRPQAFAKPSPIQVVIERVRYLEQHFQVADDTAAVTHQLLALMGNYPIGGKQVHDANIVATMLTYGIPCLLTHNAKDFERFGDRAWDGRQVQSMRRVTPRTTASFPRGQKSVAHPT